ncbi:hypothetical protein [Avibacterium paragallinarum]|uniref:hypothetical protein n=1 Tax=Avibacterium paragallinarum TaxID=728 RepID=UPI001028A722|nr:hypothetical protein [Avibacterium paragallinarum]RZN58862.1 hypothetical protein EIG78_03325 [Avibacterium paragallinarum]
MTQRKFKTPVGDYLRSKLGNHFIANYYVSKLNIIVNHYHNGTRHIFTFFNLTQCGLDEINRQLTAVKFSNEILTPKGKILTFETNKINQDHVEFLAYKLTQL